VHGDSRTPLVSPSLGLEWKAMARQQSNIDLAGSLAATLTPRAPQSSAQPLRASQNSGLFDVGALYAEAFQQVASRTRSDPRLRLPLARAAQPAWPVVAAQPAWPVAAEPTWPVAEQWPHPMLSYALEGEDPIAYAGTSHRSRGLGWFGVAVAWLATVTTSALVATTLPAHAPTHVRALPAVVAAPAPPPVVSAPTLASPPLVAPAPLPVIPTIPLSAIPVVAVPAPAAAAPAPLAHVTPKKASPKAVAPPAPHARPAPAAAVVPAPVATPPRVAAPSRPAAAPAVPAPASTAGMSLDDLIRREVQAESAKHH
jgi:hypothetical protein